MDQRLKIGNSSQGFSPRGGGASVLCTMTIPFLIAALRTRFKARETHWPASAEVTEALSTLILSTARSGGKGEDVVHTAFAVWF